MSDSLLVPVPKTHYIKGDVANQIRDRYSSFSKLTLALSALTAGSLYTYHQFGGVGIRPGSSDAQLPEFMDYLAKYGKNY
mmetsp:Transcript_14461/g.22417  ORF Transcript_14461/g.22417 Transcript_14461/m.22417 type:complete len:80 (+) Transcript_14461:13-252(+)